MAAVPRKHMKIFYDEEKMAYFVADMESKHGVLVNGIKIPKTKNVPLKDDYFILHGLSKVILIF